MPRRRALPAAALLKREQDALELKRAGVTYDVIAERLDFANRGGAYKAVQRALVRTMQAPADELRTLEVDRLERLWFAVWQKAIGGDLGCIDRLLRISERKSKLLGLDVAQAGAGRGAGELDEEIERLLVEMAGGTVEPIDHPG
jgi:hypothetical protein